MDSNTTLGTAVVLIFATIFLGLGLLARTGIWRSGWVGRYRDPDLPAYVRNEVFGAPTIGLGILLMAPILPCGPTWCGQPALLLLFVGIGILAVGLVFLFKPPTWTKPRWLIETEKAGWDEYVEASQPWVLTAIAILLMIASLIFLFSGYAPVSLGALVAGLGFALLRWRHHRTLRKSR